MEYKIISGRTTEIRRVMLDARRGYNSHVRRGTRVKGKTSLRKILANERESVKNLARVLNCNFGQGDMWITLTFSDDRLPSDRKEAQKLLAAFLRKCRSAYRKAAGKTMRYVVTIGEISTETGEKVRMHFHIVMDPLAYEAVAALWPAEDVTYRRLDGRGDYTGIARYMCQNAAHETGQKRWSTSKGLKKPVYTEPVPVQSRERIRIPRNVSLKAREEFDDQETGMVSAYVRYTRPQKEACR